MKNNWTRVLTIAAVFFVAACSQTTSSDSPEGAGKVGIFSYSPREIPADGEELLSVALAIRGNNTPSLSEVRGMEREMINKIPEGERGDFQLAIEDIKRVLRIAKMNGYYRENSNNFQEMIQEIVSDSYEGSPPENAANIITAYKYKETSFADILASMKAAGCFFTESDRVRFGKYLGW